jgi:hypothetical protein
MNASQKASTNTRITVAAVLTLGTATTALANDSANYVRAHSAYAFDPSPTQSTITCPTLEGYPDCHPDGATVAVRH